MSQKLAAKKQSINERLRANRLRRETKLVVPSFGALHSSSTSISSYKEALEDPLPIKPFEMEKDDESLSKLSLQSFLHDIYFDEKENKCNKSFDCEDIKIKILKNNIKEDEENFSVKSSSKNHSELSLHKNNFTENRNDQFYDGERSESEKTYHTSNRDIHDFLDQLSVSNNLSNDFTDNVLNLLPLNASCSDPNIKERMVTLTIELEQKNKTIKALLDAVSQLKIKNDEMTDSLHSENETKLESQKQEYEDKIQKNLNFIDELLLDKKFLTARYDQIKMDLKQERSFIEKKLNSMEERHRNEIKKMADKILNMENSCHDKWLKNKEQEIKETTLKNLEPDIQSLLSNHRIQIQHLNAKHKEEVKLNEREIRNQNEIEVNCLQKKLKSAEKTIFKLESKLEEFLNSKQFKSWMPDKQKKENKVEEPEIAIIEKFDSNLNKEECNKSVDNQTKGTLSWDDECQKQDKKNCSRELESKAEERDNIAGQIHELSKLLNYVMSSNNPDLKSLVDELFKEASCMQEQTEISMTKNFRLLHNQYENILRVKVQMYEELKLKLLETKRELCNLESQNNVLNITNRQNRLEMERMRNMLKKNLKNKDGTRNHLNQKFKNGLICLETENEKIKNELATLNDKHKTDADEYEKKEQKIIKQHELELQKIQTRVTKIMHEKDERIQELENKCFASIKKADHLETLLEKQREELIMK